MKESEIIMAIYSILRKVANSHGSVYSESSQGYYSLVQTISIQVYTTTRIAVCWVHLMLTISDVEDLVYYQAFRTIIKVSKKPSLTNTSPRTA